MTLSLAGRVSAFFLATLAVAFTGFSIALFFLVRTDLYGRIDERLDSALDTLSAAAEVEPGSVQWEPTERKMTLGLDPAPDQVRWFVHAPGGRLVDRSRNAIFSQFPTGWRQARRLLQPDGGTSPHQRDESRFPSLTLIAGASSAPVQEELRTLGMALIAISSILWLIVAMLGRKICRRALSPVTGLAQAARGLDASDLGWNLPEPGTRDELDDLGHAFNELLARLREAFERQRQFSGDASHQLRTPLTAMIGQMDVALRRDRPAAEYRCVLTGARIQAGHLAQIVESMLFLARADVEAPGCDRIPLDLDSWTSSHLLSRWSDHPRKTDFLRESSGPVSVAAHPGLLAQLLDNLLDNALKWGPPGTSVVVRTGVDSGFATLEVEDHGAGISLDDLSRVFEPFYRSAEARKAGKPGVGLGLAVARRIAEALGGSIAVSSVPGIGARFTLKLPLL